MLCLLNCWFTHSRARCCPASRVSFLLGWATGLESSRISSSTKVMSSFHGPSALFCWGTFDAPLVPRGPDESIVCGNRKDITIVFQEFEEFVGL
jgi:hypothetical protein